MKKKIFDVSFLACLTILTVCIFLVTGFLYRYYSERQTEILRTELVYIVHMAEDHGAEHLHTLGTSQRITLIDDDGNVIIDTTNTAAQNREVILSEAVPEALESGTGYCSVLLNVSEKQVTVSQLLSDGSVMCLSDTHTTYVSLLLKMGGYIIAVIAIAVAISLLLSRRLSERLLKPVYELDLTSPHKTEVYPELEPLVDRISEQNEHMRSQISALEDEHELQDKMRREFTANVSHELKTPLTSISGYAEIIRDGLVQADDVPRFAGKIYDESKRMINLVGDIIKLSQLDENEVTVNIERIDLYECCEAVIRNLESHAKKKNVTFTLSGDHCEISGAEVIIEEIIYNICDNAVKYNKDNGTVKVHIRQCIDGVEMTVTDTGIGISQEDQEHVFERFYRADKSHSQEIGGTGLGLSIVKHGAMFHNASVSIDSELGVGTTVRVLF